MKLYASVFVLLVSLLNLTVNFYTASDYQYSEAQVGSHGDIQPRRGRSGPRS
jgi:hypothetical protein